MRSAPGEAYAKSAGASSIAELRKIARRQTSGRPRSGHGLADHRWLGDSRRSIQALRGGQVQRHADSGGLQLGRRRELFASAERRRIISPASKTRYGPFADSLLKAYPAGSEHGSQDRARPDPRCGVRLAYVDLGAAASEGGEIQGLLLLFRSAPGISGRLAPGGLRLAARRGCGLRLPASQSLESADDRRRTWRSRRPWPPTG